MPRTLDPYDPNEPVGEKYLGNAALRRVERMMTFLQPEGALPEAAAELRRLILAQREADRELAALREKIAGLEADLSSAKGVVNILYAALDDASTVVDAEEGEGYAYKAELEAGASLLGIQCSGPSVREVSVLVVVEGEASHDDDEDMPGNYEFLVDLNRAASVDDLTEPQLGAIAEAVLDRFHENFGIEVLDDFKISTKLKSGREIAEMESSDLHAKDIVFNCDFVGRVDDQVEEEVGRPEMPRG